MGPPGPAPVGPAPAPPPGPVPAPVTAGAWTPAGAPHPLPFLHPRSRNWHQNQGAIFVHLDPTDLKNKAAGARRAWLVLSAIMLEPNNFWSHYPMFTQKCVLSKGVFDFAWIEATPLALQQLATPELQVNNALGAYYAFVLVEKADGSLHDVAVALVDKVPHSAHRTVVNNPQTLQRGQSNKQLWPQCK